MASGHIKIEFAFPILLSSSHCSKILMNWVLQVVFEYSMRSYPFNTDLIHLYYFLQITLFFCSQFLLKPGVLNISLLSGLCLNEHTTPSPIVFINILFPNITNSFTAFPSRVKRETGLILMLFVR